MATVITINIVLCLTVLTLIVGLITSNIRSREGQAHMAHAVRQAWALRRALARQPRYRGGYGARGPLRAS
jgi:hypothetical protein